MRVEAGQPPSEIIVVVVVVAVAVTVAVAVAAAAVVVVVVVVEYYCFFIIIIVGASVPRRAENLLCFTALSLPYELKTIVLASPPLGRGLLLLASFLSFFFWNRLKIKLFYFFRQAHHHGGVPWRRFGGTGRSGPCG